MAYCIRDDGRMLALTYQPDEDVYGWTQAVTKGLYKSVAVIREGDYDAPYFLVERTINGNTVRFIERLDKREFVDIEDAFCVDAGLQLDTPITANRVHCSEPCRDHCPVSRSQQRGYRRPQRLLRDRHLGDLRRGSEHDPERHRATRSPT